MEPAAAGQRGLAEPVGAVLAVPWSERHTPAAYRAMRRSVARRARLGTSVPFAVRVEGRLAGQVTIDNIVRGALRSGYLGYWIDRRWPAGHGLAGGGAGLRPRVRRRWGCTGCRPTSGRRTCPASASSSGWASARRAAAPVSGHRRRLARPPRLRAARRGPARWRARALARAGHYQLNAGPPQGDVVGDTPQSSHRPHN